MDAGNGLFRVRLPFPGEENLLPICRLCMNIRCTGRKETKGSGDIERSTCLFIDSEKAREHAEEEMIKVENIKGRLFLVGAEDDSFWEAGKYIRRMDRRLKERPHTCEYVPLVYEHGTHFVLPESMLRMALPVGLKFVLRFIFKAAKEYPDECEAARKDIDRRLSAALKEWRGEK